MGKNGNTFRFLLDSGGTPGKPRSIVTGSTLEDRTGTVSIIDDVAVVLEFHYDLGTIIKYTGNGLSLGSQASAISSINLTAAAMFIGQGGDNAQYYNGEMGRMLLYGSLPTTAERNSIIRGLGNQFGLTVGTVS